MPLPLPTVLAIVFWVDKLHVSELTRNLLSCYSFIDLLDPLLWLRGGLSR